MRIITKAKEQKIAEHIDNIYAAIMSHDDNELLKSVEDVFEIAYAIGGFKLVSTIHTKYNTIFKALQTELEMKLQEGEGK